MSTKEAQINLRLSGELDAWLEARAGGKRQKPEFVRQVLERERAREEEAELKAMFDAAWDSLSDQERVELRREREEWTDTYAEGPAA